MATRVRLERAALEALHGTLLAAHGAQGWWPASSRFEVVVGAVLIQRTAWRNAELALAGLRAARLLSAPALASAPVETLERLVRPAGFYRQKAARLRATASWVVAQGGLAQLEPLDDRALEAAWLGRPGIGAETAAVICLYAYGRPLFVVDAYARRLFARLGLAEVTVDDAELRSAVESALGADSAFYNEFHALVVAHAKAHCRTTPRCGGCPLAACCRHGGGVGLR